jgi:hypothetical protein
VRAPTIPPRGNYIPRGSLFVEERRGLRQASFYIGTDIHGIGRWPCPALSQEEEGKNRWWRRWAWLTKSRFNRRTIYQLIASGRHTRLPIARSRLSLETTTARGVSGGRWANLKAKGEKSKVSKMRKETRKIKKENGWEGGRRNINQKSKFDEWPNE